MRTGREEKEETVVCEAWIAKLRLEENKWKIMERQGRLKGTEIWIGENKMFRERKIEWKIKRIAEEEGRR